MLQYALLGLLQYQPMSGYDLEQFINNSIGHFWHAKLSQIYRTLKEMEEAELVTSRFEAQEEHRSKRIYTITETGRKVFAEWQSRFATELDDSKLPFLVRMFFFGSLEREHIEAQIRIWRDLHQRQLKQYETETRPRLENALQDEHISADDGFFWKATLRFGEMYEAMVLRWLDEISKDFNK
jgi:PadR family transcriptional regulator AphA